MDEITFRYRLYPSEEQAGTIRRICGVSRVFYNELLQERTDAFLRTGVWKRKLDLMETGQDRAQLNGIDVSVLNYAALDLERAFRNFHRYTMKEPDRYHSVAKTRAAFYKKFPLTDADLIGYPQERKFGGPRETFSLSLLSSPGRIDSFLFLAWGMSGS